MKKFKKEDICYVVALRDEPDGRRRYLTLMGKKLEEIGVTLFERDFSNTEPKDWLGKRFKILIEEVK